MSNWQSITPEMVLKHQRPSDGFLCPMEANTYGIEFQEFQIKDYSSGKTVYAVSCVMAEVAFGATARWWSHGDGTRSSRIRCGCGHMSHCRARYEYRRNGR